ncbi:hypothetical protein GEV33_003302 [Tenebrio molitor]|uniref:Choline transporter-like protein n=1 Tax=Tenebrio molitor TaxID=7067 RepID=A0A8J6LE79_TENMO|nr:hypothetical protein GEV33_003302 [Tenebrio molitor]
MGSSSSIMRPQELVEFRKLNTTTENIDIPARPESRTVTDKKGFLIFGLAILILIPFMIYTLVKSDLRRLGHDAYDDCGNLCGYYNKPIKDVPCSGKSYLDQSYSYEDRCVDSCPGGYTSFVGVCTPREKTRFRRSFYDDSDYESTNGIQANPLSFLLSVLTLVALRYVPGAVVWSIIVFSIVVLIGGTIGLWYFLSFYISSLVLKSCLVVIVLIVLFKKIGLVVQLYKETAKALAALPLMVFIPVVITLLQIVVLIAFVTTTVWMMTGRELYKEGENTYRYEMNGVMIFAVIFNFVITCWTLRFFAGIQHMVISGSVATWYFAKNKQYLDSPICTSLCNAMKFHLGTVAFGSFILTLFAVVKAILRACFRNACCRCLTTVCCSNVEVILKFLSDNSFIETAIHGQSYFRSAKRATKLLMNNAASVIAISCVGDFVLTMIVFIVTVVATGISFALFMNADKGAWILPVVICLIVNVIIISITFSVFQITIDTLFICFCEDSVINDGMSRPYCILDILNGKSKMLRTGSVVREGQTFGAAFFENISNNIMSSLTSNILAEQQVSTVDDDNELGEFKKISSNADADEELPAPPHSRTLTDKKGFVIFGILMLVFVSIQRQSMPKCSFFMESAGAMHVKMQENMQNVFKDVCHNVFLRLVVPHEKLERQRLKKKMLFFSPLMTTVEEEYLKNCTYREPINILEELNDQIHQELATVIPNKTSLPIASDERWSI